MVDGFIGIIAFVGLLIAVVRLHGRVGFLEREMVALRQAGGVPMAGVAPHNVAQEEPVAASSLETPLPETADLPEATEPEPVGKAGPWVMAARQAKPEVITEVTPVATKPRAELESSLGSR